MTFVQVTFQVDKTKGLSGSQHTSLITVWRQGCFRSEMVRVVCSQLSACQGPLPKSAITTRIPINSVSKKVTLRLTAPQGHRSYISGVEGIDDPKTIIMEWSKLLGCPTATLTGGSWESFAHKQNCVVVGHLRVDIGLANRAIKLSGSGALFATIVHKTDSRSDVCWVPKPKDEPSEDYVRRVAAEASKRSVPQAFRQGGGSDLGLVGVQQLEFGGGVLCLILILGCCT